RDAAEAGGDLLDVLAAFVVVVGQKNCVTIPQMAVVVLLPLPGALWVRRRDQAERDERLDVLLPLGDVDRDRWIGRDELGEAVEHTPHAVEIPYPLVVDLDLAGA